MQRLLLRISRNVTNATKTMFSNEFPGSSSSKGFYVVSVGASVQKLPKLDIPGDFVKWAFVGHRDLLLFHPFAAQAIVDFERVKDRSLEEIASI